MDIKSYLETKELSQEQFAKDIGVTQGLVWQWLNGRTRITPERAKQIEEKTGGAIGKHELCPDVFDAPKRKVASA